MKRIFEPWAVISTVFGVILAYFWKDSVGSEIRAEHLTHPLTLYIISLLLSGVVGLLSGFVFTGRKSEINYLFSHNPMPYPHWVLMAAVTVGIPALATINMSALSAAALITPAWFYYCRHAKRDNSEVLDIVYSSDIAKYRQNPMIKAAVNAALAEDCHQITVDSSSVKLTFTNGNTALFRCKDYGIDSIKHIDMVSVCLSVMLREKYRFSIAPDYDIDYTGSYTATVYSTGKVTVDRDISHFYIGNYLYIRESQRKSNSL